MNNPADNQHFLRAVIDRFEGKAAVIKTEDGQQLHWPIKNLPDEIKEGAAARLVLSTSETDQQEREKIAKTILNQLLRTEKNGNKNDKQKNPNGAG